MSLFPSCILGLSDADDFEAETVHANVFSQRVASGKELLFGFGPDHRDPGALHLVFGIVETSLRPV